MGTAALGIFYVTSCGISSATSTSRQCHVRARAECSLGCHKTAVTLTAQSRGDARTPPDVHFPSRPVSKYRGHSLLHATNTLYLTNKTSRSYFR